MVKRIHIEHLRANPKEVIDLVEREGRIAVVDDKGDVRAYLSAPKVELEEEPRELAEHFYAVRAFERLQEKFRERVRERASSAQCLQAVSEAPAVEEEASQVMNAREAADVIRREREFKRLQHALEVVRPDAHRIVIDMTSNAAPSPTITIPLEDFIGGDVLKTFDKHEELRKDKIRRRDERSKWRR